MPLLSPVTQAVDGGPHGLLIDAPIARVARAIVGPGAQEEVLIVVQVGGGGAVGLVPPEGSVEGTS